MRRVGERGAGEFERITCDEAISEITDKWKQYIDEFGPTSIAFFLGSGNTAELGGGAPEGSVMARLLNVMGGEPCSAGPRYRHAHVLDLHVRPRLGRKPCFGRSQR